MSALPPNPPTPWWLWLMIFAAAIFVGATIADYFNL